MLVRRIAALVLTLLTLHLNLLGAGSACRDHASQPSSNSAASHRAVTLASSSVASAETEMTHNMAQHEQHPCDSTPQSTCCRAIASCSIVFSTTAGTSAITRVPAGDEGVAVILNAPRSIVVAPDPPPPKA